MSSAINSYQSFLNSQSPQELISASPQKIQTLVSQLLKGKIDRPYQPGKWTARQVICHLADVEIVFAFRLRQALAETDHVIQPFDQDVWAVNYEKCDPGAALNVFCTVRAWNLGLINAQGPEVMTKKLSHPERGAMTFQTLLETMAGHDLNHLQQLETIARQD